MITTNMNGVDHNESKRRDRVSKACEFCRKKKIKCDGSNPCTHCKASNNMCEYALPQERKPRSKKSVSKVKKDEDINQLGDRLSRLESLLFNLTDKLQDGTRASKENDSTARFSNPRDEVQNTSNSSKTSEVSVEDSEESNTEYSNGGFEQVPHKKSKRSNYSNPYLSKTKVDETEPQTSLSAEIVETDDDDADKETELTQVFQISDRCFGSHSNFNIFSKKSLDWIFAKLPKEELDLLTPMQNLPLLFAVCYQSFNDIWFAPRSNDPELMKRLVEGWFPQDSSMVLDLLDCFDGIFLASLLCDSNYVKGLFKLYYENMGTKPYKFKSSELMIMNISLALCISSVIDKRMSSSCTGNSSGRTPNLFVYSTNDLILLQTRFFSSSIYYYDMISVMSDGVRTIQAILLLIIYLESSWVKSTVNYILASIAVRFAQEVGLHRSESFVDLPLEEANFRRKIWWFCEYFDMEICYRNGKPPLINPTDVSTLNSRDIVETMKKSNIPFSPSNRKIEDLDPILLSFILENKGFNSYISHYLSVLTRIRAKSYCSLFSASSCNQSFKSLVKILNEINGDMCNVAESITPSLKPRFYNDPEFDSSLIFSKEIHDGPYSIEIALTFHLTYFTHLMTVNRLISQIDNIGFNPKNKEVLKFRNLALDSTRTILHIVRKLDRNNTPFSCINWSLFYPVGAFLTLLANCLNRPESIETFDDINLLIDVAVNFFAFNLDTLATSHDIGYGKFYNQRESVSFIICVLMLNIGIRIIDSNSSYRFHENNSFIRKYMKDCKEVFPELFFRPDKSEHSEKSNITLNSTAKGATSQTSSSGNVVNSAFKIPSSMLPGPTGYLSIPFDKPKSSNGSIGATPGKGWSPGSWSFNGNQNNNHDGVHNGGSNGSDGSDSGSGIATTGSFNVGTPSGIRDQRNSLSNLLQLNPSPSNTGTTPYSTNIPNASKALFTWFNDETDFNQNLERIFGVGSPNFFYDNNIGL